MLGGEREITTKAFASNPCWWQTFASNPRGAETRPKHVRDMHDMRTCSGTVGLPTYYKLLRRTPKESQTPKDSQNQNQNQNHPPAASNQTESSATANHLPAASMRWNQPARELSGTQARPRSATNRTAAREQHSGMGIQRSLGPIDKPLHEVPSRSECVVCVYVCVYIIQFSLPILKRHDSRKKSF